MVIFQSELIDRVAKKTDFYKYNVKELFDALEETIREIYGEVDDDNPVQIQLVEGIKLGCKVLGERPRRNPATQEHVICKATAKPFATFSEKFNRDIQAQYEAKKDG